MTMKNDNDGSLCCTEKPNVAALRTAFERCRPQAGEAGEVNDAVRYATWEGQTPDNRKSGKDARPWTGASDLRVFLADDVCNDFVALCVTAFWRAVLSLEAVEAGDTRTAGIMSKVIRYFVRNRLMGKLRDEVQLSAQYMASYGWLVLHPVWEREVSRRRYELTLEMLVAWSANFPAGDPKRYIAMLIADETQDEAVAGMLEEIYQAYVANEFKDFELEETPPLAAGTAVALKRSSASSTCAPRAVSGVAGWLPE